MKIKKFNEAKYMVNVEFDTHDKDGNEVLDDELYDEIEIMAIDEEDAEDKVINLYFKTSKHPNGKIISYIDSIELKK